MSEATAEPTNDQPSDQILSDARRLLGEIQQIKTQAEEQLRAAEVARKTADSEGLLAHNAKVACESHATAIAGVKGTVESEAVSIVANKQRSDDLLAAMTTARAATEADVKTISDRRKEADASATAVSKASETAAGRVEEIDASKASVEAALKTTIAASEAGAQARAGAEAAQKQAEKASGDAQQLVANLAVSHATGKQLTETIQGLLASAQKADADHVKIWQHLEKSDENSVAYEQRIAKHSADIDALLARIEGLLPGATSAGLASSFSLQKKRFAGPQKLWLWTFVSCIGLLVILAIPSFFRAIGWSVGGPILGEPTWDATWRSLMMRLPIVLPLVWLAIYAGRNYMLSLRLEEDYAYKEAISTAFEGYKREMVAIATGAGTDITPITTLCTNVLRAIAERPGRIYEGKQQDINLITEIREFSKKNVSTI